MNQIKEAFEIGTPAWEVTVKKCLKIGFASGLFIGLAILLKVL